MALEVLVRQAKAQVKRRGRPLEEALVEVLKTEAGGRLSKLAEGPHRHKKARHWQSALLEERVEQRLLQEVGG